MEEGRVEDEARDMRGWRVKSWKKGGKGVRRAKHVGREREIK